jgi:hypothetical protein
MDSIIYTSDLHEKSLSSPIVHIDSDYKLIEIDISPWETQVFLISVSKNALFLENSLWESEQFSIVHSVLENVAKEQTKFPTLRNRVILAGVWHFGHLLGDHAHNLVREDVMHNESRRLHVSSRFQGRDNVFSLLRVSSLLLDATTVPYWLSRQRLFDIADCICIYPAENKSVPLSVARERIISTSNHEPPAYEYHFVFLTSGRPERIINVNQLSIQLSSRNWKIVNPLTCDQPLLGSILKHAKVLVAENGSILFNCFLYRAAPYYVLTSMRVQSLSERELAGGGLYNEFHSGLIYYLEFTPLKVRHHPYSDQIFVEPHRLISLEQ